MKNSIRKPVDVVLILYLVIMLSVIQLAFLYFVRSLFLWYSSYLVFEIVIQLAGSLSLIVCAQQIAKYCQEGYEGFSINFVTGTTNIAVVGTQYLVNTTLSSFIDASHFSARSVMFVLIFCIEMSIISFLIALYFFKIKK